MSLERYFAGDGALGYLQAQAACLAAVGSPAFNVAFLELVETVIKADQCMVFSYQEPRPECYLSYAQNPNKFATNIAQRYLRSGFRDDPLRPMVDELRGTDDVRVVNFADIKDGMSQDYLETFFVAQEISDKISVICSGRGETLVLNFYRYQQNGPFVVSAPALRTAFWQTIAHMALLHFTDPGRSALTSPLNSLSAREKDICEAMLQGHTSEAIAWRLDISPNTVKTYRQRAYAKLGINSKSALFALCNGPSGR